MLIVDYHAAEAILSTGNGGKHLGDRGSAPDPIGELTALPRLPSWWEALLPLPKYAIPTLGLRGVWALQWKKRTRPLIFPVKRRSIMNGIKCTKYSAAVGILLIISRQHTASVVCLHIDSTDSWYNCHNRLHWLSWSMAVQDVCILDGLFHLSINSFSLLTIEHLNAMYWHAYFLFNKQNVIIHFVFELLKE